MNKLNKIIDKYGYTVFLKLIVAPLFLIITTPFMMSKLWWNCRILLQGKLDQYHRFSGIPSTNCFFYWTQAFNLKTFSKNGVSNLIGLGNYNLTNFFHVPRFGNFLFWKFSLIVTLFSFLGFTLSHVLWCLNNYGDYPIYVTLIILFSVLLYSCIDRVNYNSLGWLLFPCLVWAISSNNYLVISVTSGFIGVFSITVGVFAFMLSLVYFISNFDFIYLYIMFPLILVTLYRMYPLLKSKNIKKNDSVFINILKMIGVFTDQVKYKRQKKISILGIYFTTLFSLYLLTALYQSNWKFNEYLTLLSIFMLLLFLGESAIFRFADSHSYLISTWSVTAAYTIIAEDPVLLCSFLIISNPIPLFGLFCTKKPTILKVPERRPIFVGNAISKVREFLSVIKKCEKVLFQFDNPNGSYNKIFDGYRNFYELLLYCGNTQGLHIFPDWYFIQETNTPDGLEVWGRNVSDVFPREKKFRLTIS